MLLGKVVYDGTHGGDLLNLQDVEDLAVEMDAVHALHCPNLRDEELLRNFETQMIDLIRASRSVRKPIVF